MTDGDEWFLMAELQGPDDTSQSPTADEALISMRKSAIKKRETDSSMIGFENFCGDSDSVEMAFAQWKETSIRNNNFEDFDTDMMLSIPPRLVLFYLLAVFCIGTSIWLNELESNEEAIKIYGTKVAGLMEPTVSAKSTRKEHDYFSNIKLPERKTHSVHEIWASSPPSPLVEFQQSSKNLWRCRQENQKLQTQFREMLHLLHLQKNRQDETHRKLMTTLGAIADN